MNATTKKQPLPATTTPTKTDAVTPEQANEALNQIYLTGESTIGLTEEQCLEILENTPTESLQEQTADYFDFSVAGTFNLVFEGMSTTTMMDKVTHKPKTIDIVKLKDKANKRYIAGGAVLVNTCKNLQQVPSFIRVITTGKKVSGQGGDYYEMRVLTF
jgi:hypothetical protein